MPDDKGFEVRDKRKVRMEGEEAPAHSDEKPAGREKAEERAPEPGAWQQESPDFIAFVGSLGATALMYMGEKLSPEQPDGPTDLAGAKQMIDMLDMLKLKTKGNLGKEEEEMLDNLLYNLRIRFVRLAGNK